MITTTAFVFSSEVSIIKNGQDHTRWLYGTDINNIILIQRKPRL